MDKENYPVSNFINLISSFRRVLYVVCFLLGNYPKESIQLYKLYIFVAPESYRMGWACSAHAQGTYC